MSDPDSENDPAKSEREKRKLISNERIKASASLLNSIANTTIAAGTVGAIAADLYGVTVPKTPYWLMFAGCWAGVGVAMHAVSRWTLGGLKP